MATPPRPGSNEPGGTPACCGSAQGRTRSCARSSPRPWGCKHGNSLRRHAQSGSVPGGAPGTPGRRPQVRRGPDPSARRGVGGGRRLPVPRGVPGRRLARPVRGEVRGGVRGHRARSGRRRGDHRGAGPVRLGWRGRGAGGAQGSGAVLPVPVRRPGAATAMAGPGCGRRGDRGAGFAYLMEGFSWERVVMALAAVAGAQATLELATAYGRERRAFGRPVATFQVWRHRFADLATEIEAARSLTYHALRKIVGGEDATAAVSMAKWYSSELAWKVADEALQIHGGYGYMMEFPVQRASRDSRLG